MSIQDKYKWNWVKLAGQIWARGMTQKMMDLHNDSIDALAIELEQRVNDEDDMWQEFIELEDNYRECMKLLNEVKQDLSDMQNNINRGNPRNSKKHYAKH